MAISTIGTERALDEKWKEWPIYIGVYLQGVKKYERKRCKI